MAQHRDKMPSSDLLVTYDRPEHPAARSLLMRLLTPRRLAENKTYLRAITERPTDGIPMQGSTEMDTKEKTG
jgi:cytochrome P450